MTTATPQKVRSVLIKAGFRPGAADGMNEEGGFVARTLRRAGRQYTTFHGVHHEVDRAVQVRHIFGANQERDVAAEMEMLSRYAQALVQAEMKAEVHVAGAALGEKHTWRYVEVG